MGVGEGGQMGLRSRERPWSLPPASNHDFQSLNFLFHDPCFLFAFLSFFFKKIFYFSSTQEMGHEALSPASDPEIKSKAPGSLRILAISPVRAC